MKKVVIYLFTLTFLIGINGLYATEALWEACFSGDLRKVHRLILKKADVNYMVKSGITPLMGASLHNYSDVVKMLVENKANVNASATKGSTALKLASKYADSNLVVYLKDHGAQ